MPFGDGTGPAGHGPRTGRGLGYCSGFRVPGFQNGPRFGRGLGRGRGFARGMRQGYCVPYTAPANPYYPPYNAEDEVEYLKETARALENELNVVKEQLKKIEDNND